MKKFILFFFIGSILINCTKNTTDIPTPPPAPQDLNPVAVDDAISSVEDNELIISNLLSNDTVVDRAVIKSFDQTSTQNGTIVDNRDGTYTYTPPSAFVGEDTFTYTLCDDDTPSPHCSTATVTITVTDEGNPIAANDTVNALKNTALVITDLLENDTVIDDAILTTVDNTGTTGTATLNDDNSITYTPQDGFLGEDTFSYSICDDDSPEATCSTATVTVTVIETISFNIPSELAAYYQDMTFTDNADLLYTQLTAHTTDKHTTILTYSQRHDYLYDADEDENNTENVILMYTGESRYWKEYTSGSNSHTTQTFNTEHIYPQSLLSDNDAITDLHHLRTCDASVNSTRSNHPFTNGSGANKLENQKWYPGDDWRGDVARMVMYLNLRYEETFEKVGTLELFLEWNVADPVSTFEIQRNNVIQGAQGNRNPFIDNPYLATLIWGGDPAENKWN